MSNYFILMYLKKKKIVFPLPTFETESFRSRDLDPSGGGLWVIALNDAETLSPAGCGV